MTISLERLKISDFSVFSISVIATAIMGIIVVIYPYGRETWPIPLIGGIFYRSLFVIMIIFTAWVARYGFVRAFKLLPTYYIFHETIFVTIWFAAYGINILSTITLATPFWDMRFIPFPLVIFLLYRYKMFRINFDSVFFGLLNISWLLLLLGIWPWQWLYAEGNIPPQILPQLEEFIYNILSPLWFFYLVRYKNGSNV